MQLAVCHRSTIQVRHRALTNPNNAGCVACDVTPSSRAQRPKQTHCDSSRMTAGRSIGRRYERCSVDEAPWVVKVKWQVTAVANVAHLLQCNAGHIDTRVFILAHRTCAFILAHWHMCLYLGTSTHVPLSWHIDTCTLSWRIDTCAFILPHRNMCLYLGTSTLVPYLGTLTHVSLFWHIDTRVFILAHRHMWFYLGTSKHEPLSWHIDTSAFIFAHRHVCL